MDETELISVEVIATITRYRKIFRIGTGI